MIRIFLFMLVTLIFSPAYATGFSDVVSKRCADTSSRISESFKFLAFNQAPSETGFAEVYFGLPTDSAMKSKVDEFKITFNCMKSGRAGGPSLDDAMVFVDMSYASSRSNPNNSMKRTNLPDEAVEASIGELVSKSLAIAPADGLSLTKTCFRKALSNPTHKFRDQRTDEKTFIFTAAASPEVECTRRERLDTGEVTFLMHFRLGTGTKK